MDQLAGSAYASRVDAEWDRVVSSGTRRTRPAEVLAAFDKAIAAEEAKA
jgi:hypothetical protein